MSQIIPYQSLVVSCQALEGEPLHGADIMAKMSIAALQGGASGIRANGIRDIQAIRNVVELPIIGLLKKQYKNSEIFITPTIEDALAVSEAGADIVAIDATNRTRPDGYTLKDTINILKDKGVVVMADISTVEEGEIAALYGADYISTTLSGYTPYSRQLELPDIELVEQLSERLDCPVVAEGRISCPEQAVAALQAGAHFVVVGGAITRPQQITKSYIQKIREQKNKYARNG